MLQGCCNLAALLRHSWGVQQELHKDHQEETLPDYGLVCGDCGQHDHGVFGSDEWHGKEIPEQLPEDWACRGLRHTAEGKKTEK